MNQPACIFLKDKGIKYYQPVECYHFLLKDSTEIVGNHPIIYFLFDELAIFLYSFVILINSYISILLLFIRLQPDITEYLRI